MHPLTVHQYHPTVAFGDAITQQMFFLRESLFSAGIGGEIFASDFRNVSRTSVRPFRAEQMGDADLILVHHSLYNPQLGAVLDSGLPAALVYHNITPPEFFPHDADMAQRSRLGRRQLEEFRDRFHGVFVDSDFNGVELTALGYSHVRMLPLLNCADKNGTPPHRSPETGRLLFVGRLAPHKGQAELLKVLYYLKRFGRRPYTLTLVGGGDPLYTDYLHLLARQLGLGDVVNFAGKVSHSDLHQFYGRAEAYVSLSRHEGFGVPLVESLQHHLPIFALPLAGIPETLGDAAFWLPDRPPVEVAAFLDSTLNSPAWGDLIAEWNRSSDRRRQLLADAQNPDRAVAAITTLARRSRLQEAVSSSGTERPAPPLS